MKVIGDQVFYSTEETARLLGVTTRTVHRWLAEQGSTPKQVAGLKAYHSPTGRRFFRQKDIHDIVSRCWGVQLAPRTQRMPKSTHA